MLRAGVGPSLSAGMRCPACAGGLGSWGGGYRRRVRVSRARFRLLVRRARCKVCERTHALLPGFLFAHRLDVVDVVGCALEMAAEGQSLEAKTNLQPPALRASKTRPFVSLGWLDT
jgi:hypothetical protein